MHAILFVSRWMQPAARPTRVLSASDAAAAHCVAQPFRPLFPGLIACAAASGVKKDGAVAAAETMKQLQNNFCLPDTYTTTAVCT